MTILPKSGFVAGVPYSHSTIKTSLTGGSPQTPLMSISYAVCSGNPWTACGAACLAMILTHFGRKTSVAECRDKCSPGRDGLTARVIARAAQEFGLRVKAYSLEPPAMSEVPLPALAHWNFNHFIVVEALSGTRVRIVDPSTGRRVLTAQEFAAGFTGVVLTLEPGIRFESRKK